MVDERSEIAACYLGVAQNDIGNSSDVLDNCPEVTWHEDAFALYVTGCDCSG